MKKITPLLFAVLLAGCQLIPSTKSTASFKLTDPKITIITPTTMSTPSAEITQVTAIMKTSQGEITIELFPKSAPKTVANFIGLSNKSFYNGTIFHRVIKDFMIQGGDPLGTGTGGPGYKFEDEFDSSLNFSEPYMLAMANSGPATNGSQFFITVVPTTWLNNKHTIFGKVTKGQEIVDAIVSAPTLAGNKPIDDIKIIGIDIVEK